MKKICFISDSFLWEEKIRPVLHRAISHVIEQNDAVEFWFHESLFLKSKLLLWQSLTL